MAIGYLTTRPPGLPESHEDVESSRGVAPLFEGSEEEDDDDDGECFGKGAGK